MKRIHFEFVFDVPDEVTDDELDEIFWRAYVQVNEPADAEGDDAWFSTTIKRSGWTDALP